MKRKPHCKKHPEQALICPKCVGRKGGEKSLASITPEQFKDWGKRGGRPRKTSRDEADTILNFFAYQLPPEKMKDHDAKFIGEMLAASSEASWTPTLAEMAKLRKIKEAYK